MYFILFSHQSSLHTSPSVSSSGSRLHGHDEPTDDHSSANATDPVPSSAPGPAAAAAGSYATAGTNSTLCAHLAQIIPLFIHVIKTALSRTISVILIPFLKYRHYLCQNQPDMCAYTKNLILDLTLLLQ